MRPALDDDAALLAECELDTYRGPGPGGQKRNKTDSAVRLRHKPSGLIVVAGESRSQAENRSRALRRLREALALRLRRPVPPGEIPPAIAEATGKDGRLRVGRRDGRYLPAAAAALDVLQAESGSVSAAAARLGLTTGNLSSFLTADADLIAAANAIRAGFGLKRLRND
jgi:hypothetical protein